jgi:hypothetical protein
LHPVEELMMIARLLDTSLRHRRWVLALWLAVLVAGFAAAPTLFGRLTSEAGSIDNTESERAARAVFTAVRDAERARVLMLARRGAWRIRLRAERFFFAICASLFILRGTCR